MARQHGQMELFAHLLGEDAPPEDYRSLALHFEADRNDFLSGKFHHMSGDNSKVNAN